MNSIVLSIVTGIIHCLPESRCFRLKRILLRLSGVSVGDNVRIASSVRILGYGALSIGDDTWIGHEVLIVCTSRIDIGSYVDIAPRVYIGNGTHEIGINSNHIASKGFSKDVKIGDGSWLCANSTILPGVTIGKKCVVAAGAVVTKSFEDMIIIGGVPAKLIKRI